jgi:hypothetical protein
VDEDEESDDEDRETLIEDVDEESDDEERPRVFVWK